MKIFLAYDRENAANASYWEHYFKSCGIWAEKKSFKEKLKIPSGFKGVAIVSPKNLEKCSAGNISDYIYRIPDGNRSITSHFYMPVTAKGHTVAVGSSCLSDRTKLHVTIKPESGKLAGAKLKGLARGENDQLRKTRVSTLAETDGDKRMKTRVSTLAETDGDKRTKTRVSTFAEADGDKWTKTRVSTLSKTDSDKRTKTRVSTLSKTGSDKRRKTNMPVMEVVTNEFQAGVDVSDWSDTDKCVRRKAFKPVRMHARVAERGDDVSVVPEKYYRSLIKSVSREEKEYQTLKQLFRIYSGNQLWKACWFYEEFAKGDIRRWDEEIVQICEKGLDSIRESIRETEDEHIRYMEFYYRYVLCGAGYRALSRRHEKCRELLEDFRPVLERYGSNAMFQHLAGRICELSSVANKQAVFYYQKAVKQQPCSDFYYDLGHSFEKVYGDDKMALRFYREACELDSDNYKALYKLASGYEMQREWIEAYCLYSRIEKKLGALIEKNYQCGSAVSVQEIEYPYKACKRLSHICRQIFGWGDEEDRYVKERLEITAKYLSAKSFSKLTALMGEPEKGGEIEEEIKNKFTGKCYQ